MPENLPIFIVPADAIVVGTLSYPGDVALRGTFDGDVRCRNLVISAEARVVGAIVAEVADISGEVDADIYADSLYLRDGCAVVGSAHHAQLTLEAGAVFEGKSRRHPNPRALAPDPADGGESEPA